MRESSNVIGRGGSKPVAPRLSFSRFKGGVKLAKTIPDAVDYTSQMLGNRLITHQTTKDGQPVHKIFIAECLDIKVCLAPQLLTNPCP